MAASLPCWREKLASSDATLWGPSATRAPKSSSHGMRRHLAWEVHSKYKAPLWTREFFAARITEDDEIHLGAKLESHEGRQTWEALWRACLPEALARKLAVHPGHTVCTGQRQVSCPGICPGPWTCPTPSNSGGTSAWCCKRHLQRAFTSVSAWSAIQASHPAEKRQSSCPSTQAQIGGKHCHGVQRHRHSHAQHRWVTQSSQHPWEVQKGES